MSPGGMYLLYVNMYQARGDGYLHNYYVGKDERALRPALSLKSTTTISGGNGTASSPFIIS